MKIRVQFILYTIIFCSLLTTNAQDMFSAAINGKEDLIKNAIKNNQNWIDSTNRRGRTLLHQACYGGQFKLAEYLINKGAVVNRKDKNDYNIIHFIIHSMAHPKNKYEFSKKILKTNPSLAKARNNTGLEPLAWAGNDIESTIDLLLNCGVNVNAQDYNGFSALHHWTMYWKDDLSQYLIDKGANVNLKDNFNRTPLHLAAITGREDKMLLLLKNKADINLTDKFGYTPLDYTKKYNHAGLEKELINLGGISNNQNDMDLVKTNLKANEVAVWYFSNNSWDVRLNDNVLFFNYDRRISVLHDLQMETAHLDLASLLISHNY